MKSLIVITASALALTAGATTVVSPADSVSPKEQALSELVVMGVRAPKDAPLAVANIHEKTLESFARTGREMPMLFTRTPGVTAWSENGVGTGTTYLRIRGAADSRINVTLDGVPMNSPEDQCVFWANMNSYASVLQSVQIQRGVGTSTCGDGAFGGTVSMHSKAPSETAGLKLDASYGSYGTTCFGGSFSTGRLWGHLVFDGAYHETRTDGYVHGTDGRSGSYYGGLSWLGSSDWRVSYKHFGNFEKTGQAWNGVTAGNDDATLMDDGIRTYKDMCAHGLGRFNSLYERLVFDDDNWCFPKDANGNYQTERYTMRDGKYWPRTTDNFYQNHNLLSGVWRVNDRWTANATLHYTHGHGYYDEFRYDNKLKKYGLPNFTGTDGKTVKRTDFVRQKGMTQDAWGAVANAQYQSQALQLVTGASAQLFKANHYGYLTYIANPEVDALYRAHGDYQYYDSDARKNDFSAFIKATWHLTEALSLFADAQYRHVHYTTSGINDRFVDNGDGTYSNQRLDILKNYHFFNPKGGLTYATGAHRAYASIAWSHREPERNNFTDNYNYPAPTAERLLDYELGYQYTTGTLHLGANFYYMDYTNQFVQTGEVSEIGENLTTNIPSSYRMGVELTAAYSPLSWLTIEGNAALSRNKIKDFTEVVIDWDDSRNTVHYDNSTLAFSPSAVLNGFVDAHYRGFQATWHTAFVSRQHLDNSGNRQRSLPCYSTSSLSLDYTFTGLRRALGVKSVTVGVDLNNIFDRQYAASGWVYSTFGPSCGYTNDNRYYQIGFTPMAGFTAMGRVSVAF